MDVSYYNGLIEEVKDIHQPKLPLTPEQEAAFRLFAGHTLIYLDGVRERTGFGMCLKNTVNQKFNYLVREGKYPGGYLGAMDRMIREGLLVLVPVNRKTVVVSGVTHEEIQSNKKNDFDDCTSIYIEGWKLVELSQGETPPK